MSDCKPHTWKFLEPTPERQEFMRLAGLPLRGEDIDEFVRDTLRNYMKPQLRDVYRSMLDDSPERTEE